MGASRVRLEGEAIEVEFGHPAGIPEAVFEALTPPAELTEEQQKALWEQERYLSAGPLWNR